jgi:hypothetical protein
MPDRLWSGCPVCYRKFTKIDSVVNFIALQATACRWLSLTLPWLLPRISELCRETVSGRIFGHAFMRLESETCPDIENACVAKRAVRRQDES